MTNAFFVVVLLTIAVGVHSADHCVAEDCGSSCSMTSPGIVACLEGEDFAYCGAWDLNGMIIMETMIECVDGVCTVTADSCPGIDPEG